MASFTKLPNNPFMLSNEGPEVAVITDDVPDWVRLPIPDLLHHPHAGMRKDVECVAARDCPKCQTPSREFVLEDTDIGVVECAADCGFVWFKKRETGNA
jgi:Zn ribbon nucleic-acid-binding protein